MENIDRFEREMALRFKGDAGQDFDHPHRFNLESTGTDFVKGHLEALQHTKMLRGYIRIGSHEIMRPVPLKMLNRAKDWLGLLEPRTPGARILAREQFSRYREKVRDIYFPMVYLSWAWGEGKERMVTSCAGLWPRGLLERKLTFIEDRLMFKRGTYDSVPTRYRNYPKTIGGLDLVSLEIAFLDRWTLCGASKFIDKIIELGLVK